MSNHFTVRIMIRKHRVTQLWEGEDRRSYEMDGRSSIPGKIINFMSKQ
jgi:hypothetical protein